MTFEDMAYNFYRKDGEMKGIPQHKPKKEYFLEKHLKAIRDEKLRVKIENFIGSIKDKKKVTMQISKYRVCFINNYIFLKILTRKTFVHLDIKDDLGWNRITVNRESLNILDSYLKKLTHHINNGRVCMKNPAYFKISQEI